MGNTININYDKIYKINEIYDFFLDPKNFNNINKLMNDLNAKNPKFLKIFICEDFYEKGETDYILSHGEYQYYVAEICLKSTVLQILYGMY